MSKLTFSVDLAKGRERAAAMPSTIDTLDEVAEGLRGLYAEAVSGGFTLDTQAHGELLGELDRLIEKRKSDEENERLRRTLVVDHVRRELSQYVKKEFLAGC